MARLIALKDVLEFIPFKMGELWGVPGRAGTGDSGKGTEFHWSKALVGTVFVTFCPISQEKSTSYT